MLGERILELRKDKNLTLRELSQEIGVSVSAVSMYESGKRNPDHDTLLKIANYFNVTTDYLLNRNTVITDEESQQLLGEAYFRVMQDAKNSGLSPNDISLAIEFMKRAKQRDEQID